MLRQRLLLIPAAFVFAAMNSILILLRNQQFHGEAVLEAAGFDGFFGVDAEFDIGQKLLAGELAGLR
jgi:hypothetical protein